MFEILHGFKVLADSVEQSRRRKRELVPVVLAQIEREGGTVKRSRSLSGRLVLRTPFRRQLIQVEKTKPLLLQVFCKYPHDYGCWFVRVREPGAIDWVWRSANGRDRPPSDRNGVSVKNDIVVVPPWASVLAVFAAISLVIVAVGAISDA